MEKLKIETASQRRLASSLKAKIAAAEALDGVARKAVASGEWATQVYALDSVATQSARLYDEIVASPVPGGLSTDDEKTYRELLAEQARPRRETGEAAAAKLKEFWANADAVAQLEARLRERTAQDRWATGERARAETLAQLAPEPLRARLTERTASLPAATSPAAKAPATTPLREALRRDPFNRDRLQALLKAERDGGNSAMSSYLEARLQALDAPAKGAHP
jgi:hypothetical protein